MKSNSEKGQAVLLVVVAMGLFLFGALGLAIDVSRWFAHQQMAQVAADAAAQAAMLSIFQGVNDPLNTSAQCTKNIPNSCFPTDAPFLCSAHPDSTPCKYVAMNGFGNDKTTVSFPPCISTLNAVCSNSLTPNAVQVTITRLVGNAFIRMIGGPAANSIGATGIAAALTVIAPIPLLITHPTLDHSLSSTGGPTKIIICGGPQKSVQINSSNTVAYGPSKDGTVDLSHAGPADPGDCSTGTGADFGVFGGVSSDSNVWNSSSGNSTTGIYRSGQSPIEDPLRDVPAPSVPTKPGAWSVITEGTDGCISGGKLPPDKTNRYCYEYFPGLWVDGLNVKNNLPVIFKPGLYYMQGGGFTMKGVNGGGGGPGWNAMCPPLNAGNGCAEDPATGMGMVVYDTGSIGSTNTGGFSIDTGTHISLIGPTLLTTVIDPNTGLPVIDPVTGKAEMVPAAPYYGIAFWEDRSAAAHTGNGAHSFGSGTGCFSVTGTMYLTNWRSLMDDPTHYQAVEYNGGPCSTTINAGEIIVGTLHMNGGSVLKMNLSPYAYLRVQQVALVGGGPHF